MHTDEDVVLCTSHVKTHMLFTCDTYHRALRGFLEDLMAHHAPSVISGAKFDRFSFGKTPCVILGIKDLTHAPTFDSTQLAIGVCGGVYV